MQDLKVYIVIENPTTKQDVSIKGDFEILRAFLLGVGALDTESDQTPIQTLPAEDPQQCKGEARVQV